MRISELLAKIRRKNKSTADNKATPPADLAAEDFDSTAAHENVTAHDNGYVLVDRFTQDNGTAHDNGFESVDGFAHDNGRAHSNGFVLVDGFAHDNGRVHDNGFESVDGFTYDNGRVHDNGFVLVDGFAHDNGFTHDNGKSSTKKQNQVIEPSPAKVKAIRVAKPKKARRVVSLGERIRRRLFATRLVISLLSMLFYTIFTLVMLQKNWGNTIYNTIVLCFIGLYVLLFLVMIVLSQRLSRSAKKLSRSFQDYKSGLKIMNSVLRLINFFLTVSLFFTAAAARNTNTPFQTTVMVVSVVWAVFQIFFQVFMIRRRHKIMKSLRGEKAEGRRRRRFFWR